MYNFKYCCIVDTIYPLCLYLLYQSESNIKKTIFYIGDSLKKDFYNKLPNVIFIEKPQSTNYFKKFIFYLKLHKERRKIKNTIIYAQDHLYFSAPLIDNKQYTLLEDAPSIYSIYKNFTHFRPFFKNTFKGKIRNFFIGRIYGRQLGDNQYCINRLVTSIPQDSDILKNRKCELCNIQNMWLKSSNKKKKLIRDILGNENDESYSGKVIIFTQPFVYDCKLTAQEQISIYHPYIKQYGEDNVVIKPHPRDTINYNLFYPNIKILRTKLPMQLLTAIGYTYSIAITVCSSAISSMPTDTKIIWIGSEVDERIVKVYGHINNPCEIKT